MDNQTNNQEKLPEGHAFSFVMGVGDYRRMLYFNTFARQRGKSWFIVFSWVVSVVLLLLEAWGAFAPLDRVAHGCMMLVGVSFPALVLTMEYSIYKFRRSHPEAFQEVRTYTFQENGVVLSGMDAQNHAKGMIFEKWEEFGNVYETKSLLVVYRNNRELALVPKSAIAQTELPALRRLLSDKLGARFVLRV